MSGWIALLLIALGGGPIVLYAIFAVREQNLSSPWLWREGNRPSRLLARPIRPDGTLDRDVYRR